MQISAHETDHVTFLIAGLGAGSANFVAKPTFDFTVNGAFDPFNKTGIELRRRTHNFLQHKLLKILGSCLQRTSS
jgi:hypothetical protein